MISGKFEEDIKILYSVDPDIKWGMTGEIQKYFLERMQSAYDYGAEWFKEASDKIGTACLNRYPGDTWTVLCMLTVTKKYLAALHSHKMSIQNLRQDKHYYPILDTPKLPPNSKVYLTDFGFSWSSDPTVQIQVTLVLYRFNEKVEEPAPKAEPEVEEAPKEEPIVSEPEPEEPVVSEPESEAPVKEEPKPKKKSRRKKAKKK